jgi:hypothetical protein
MKHLDLRFFWLRIMVSSGVAVRYIPTAAMPADLLTKVLACVKVAAALPQLGLTQHTKLVPLPRSGASVSVGACGSMDSTWTGVPVARIMRFQSSVARDLCSSI